MLKRILIADDDPSIQAIFAAFLKNEPYALSFVSNGLEAVQAVEAGAPDLVLLDMEMPVMSGYDAARHIRAVYPSSRLPVIGLTGNDEPDTEKECLLAGCTFYVAKPVGRARLVDAVRHALGSGARVESAGGGLEVPPALAARFIEERRLDVKRAKELLSGRKFADIARIGHQMKGSSGTLGFPGIGRAGASLENAAASGDAEATEAAIRWLRSEVDSAAG